MKQLLTFIIVAIVAAGCGGPMPDNVEYALKKAGSNRDELEKVIKHYRIRFKKEKLEAAYFLIGNMPGKFGKYYPENVFYFDLLNKTDSVLKSPCKDFADQFVTQYLAEGDRKKSVKLQEVPDLKIMTADYLIENIDLAFKVWKEKPWAQHVEFDDFCEWILPYRFSTEPLQRWRPYLLRKLEHLEDSLENPSDPKELGMIINKMISKDFIYTNKLNFLPRLGGVDIWRYKAGICEHSYLVTTLAMRSVGIPISRDFTYKYAVWPGEHAWLVLHDSDGQIKPFDGGAKKMKFFDPPNCPNYYEGIALVTTVFRDLYAKNERHVKLAKNKSIPSTLIDEYVKEVSQAYDSTNRNDLEVTINQVGISTYAILYSFDQGIQLTPVSYAKILGGKALFKSIQYGGIYVVGFVSGDRIIADSNPFIWEEGNKKNYLIPNMNKTFSFPLYRKYPPQDPVPSFYHGMIGAKIEASNNPDFTNSELIHVIKDTNNYDPVEVPLRINKKFRYYRYVSSETRDIRIAEVLLYIANSSGKKTALHGRVFGYLPVDTYCNEGIFEHAFDGNIATNFNAPNNSWVAIDAGKPVKLKSLNVIVRNHINFVEPGNTYELLFFDKGWYSLGKKQADDYVIVYDNIPAGAVYLLRNHTKGKEERIFLIEDNKQSWR